MKVDIVTLEDTHIKLVPFDSLKDYEYLINLSMENKHNKFSRLFIKSLLENFDTICWTVIDKNGEFPVGVVYLTHVPDMFWTLDAYRDDELISMIGNKPNYSYRAGKLATEWAFENITKELYTIHDKCNRAATILCKKLGFKMVEEITSNLGVHVKLKKEK